MQSVFMKIFYWVNSKKFIDQCPFLLKDYRNRIKELHQLVQYNLSKIVAPKNGIQLLIEE